MFILFLKCKNQLIYRKTVNVWIYASYKKKKSAGRGKKRSEEENYAYNLELATRERQRVRGGGDSALTGLTVPRTRVAPPTPLSPTLFLCFFMRAVTEMHRRKRKGI
jgi:hypothetical protein